METVCSLQTYIPKHNSLIYSNILFYETLHFLFFLAVMKIKIAQTASTLLHFTKVSDFFFL